VDGVIGGGTKKAFENFPLSRFMSVEQVKDFQIIDEDMQGFFPGNEIKKGDRILLNEDNGTIVVYTSRNEVKVYS